MRTGILNRQRDAVPILAQLADSSPRQGEVQDDALYQLAWCQMDIQAWNDAKNTWRTLLRRFPRLALHAGGESYSSRNST